MACNNRVEGLLNFRTTTQLYNDQTERLSQEAFICCAKTDWSILVQLTEVLGRNVLAWSLLGGRSLKTG